jgi:hypothetical protein
LGRRPRVGDKAQGGLRVRLKGKAGDLGEARSGKGRRGSRSGRCAAGGVRRKKGKEEIGTDRWGRVVRERGKQGAAEEGRGQLGCARMADRGLEGRTGRLAGLRGKEKSRPGWTRSWVGLPTFFLFSLFSFLFSNSNSNHAIK